MSKFKKIFLCLLPLMMVVIFGVNYVFYEPTEINALIAAKLYSAPANNYFKDDNFYKCVIDAHNRYNYYEEELNYTDSISDEQLSKITRLIVCATHPTKNEISTSISFY